MSTTIKHPSKTLIVCKNGHRHFMWFSRRDGIMRGLFATGEEVDMVLEDSYAYTHGGCCYRAAVDRLAEINGR